MPCVFCRIIARELPANLLFEDDVLISFLDIHPWRPGHALVLPKAHHPRVAELSSSVRASLMELGTEIGTALREAGFAKDVHLLINDGRAANQSVPHVHLHVLPRTGGDFWRLFGGVVQHGIASLLKPAPRDELDRQAESIRR